MSHCHNLPSVAKIPETNLEIIPLHATVLDVIYCFCYSWAQSEGEHHSRENEVEQGHSSLDGQETESSLGKGW